MKAVLGRDGTTVIQRIEPALSLKERMKGLLGRHSLEPGQAMYLSPCQSIHTFFMKFSLDLVFLGKTGVVTKIVRDVQPNRMVFGGRGSHCVLEMETGWLKDGTINIGDRLDVR